MCYIGLPLGQQMLGCLVWLRKASWAHWGHPVPCVLGPTLALHLCPQMPHLQPGCPDMAACCHSCWCPFPSDLPAPLRCHLWVVVSQVAAGAHCSASLVGAAAATCATLDSRLPPVRLPSLAHAAAPPDLSPALRSDGNAAQLDVRLRVPLLLQVWSPPADVRASLLIPFACEQGCVVLLCSGKKTSWPTGL